MGRPAICDTTLELYCDQILRRGYGWRAENRQHKLRFRLGVDTVPDDPQPCPAPGCSGTIHVRSGQRAPVAPPPISTETPPPKKRRRKKAEEPPEIEEPPEVD